MLNKAMLIGNVGRDPDTRTTDSGTKIARLSVATNRRWTSGAGERREETEWHQVVAFGRLAEIVADLVTKGRLVYVEGRIHTTSWRDSDSDEPRSRTEIIANTVRLLDRRTDEQEVDDAPAEEPDPS